MLDESQIVTIIVQAHPALEKGPVQLNVLASEVGDIDQAALQVAVLDIFMPGETEPRHVVVDAKLFDELATEPMADVLQAALLVAGLARGRGCG